MPSVPQENLAAARHLYRKRIKTLQIAMTRVVEQGIFLGEAFESETMLALDEIEKEVDSIQECLCVLDHLQGWQ